MGKSRKNTAPRADNTTKKRLPELLREIRREAGVSIKEAGRELGVSYTYLSKIENGLTSPSETLIGRMATYFQRDSTALFAAAGKLPPDIAAILSERGEEAFTLLRRRFGRGQ